MPSHDPNQSTFGNLQCRKLAPAPLCLFSVDVEDWFHSNFASLRDFDSTGLPRRVQHGVVNLLEEMAQSGARATFFVLGVIAEEHPRLVRQIAEAGHEIACHSYRHTLLHEQSPAELRADLERARNVLREQSGQPVLGFRAPSWSVDERNLWALDVIAEVGFRYDSSIFPVRNYLYGVNGVPDVPYELRTPAGSTLLEVPPSTLGVAGRRIGVGGGFYLRTFPLFVQRYALRSALSRGAPFTMYVHPREFDAPAWRYRLPLSRREQWIYSFGLRRGQERLRALLREQHWQPMGALLEQHSAGANNGG
jgi:polysaccharide deacetylase family protein (PEP-CTERM system associated)